MLGGLALKWRWRERRRAAGKSTDRPNLVIGANVQICWEKFCRYWDIEPRKMPLEPGRTCLTADAAAALCDENTIGDADGLPEDLRFNVDYLGGTTPTFSLNFSRAAFPVIAQYYTMVRLGREGFRRVQLACRDTARWLAEEIMDMGRFVLLGDGRTIPVLAFRLADDVQHYSVFDISELLRLHRWQVPAYTLPANLQDTAVLRMVIRNGFGRDLAQLVAQDLRRVTEQLDQAGPLPPHGRRTSFHH
jgi:glutamate/tyrosine decarboxylase-like PLP-dependent enzyme